jgi:sortase (surface protein transpeptidase)
MSSGGRRVAAREAGIAARAAAVVLALAVAACAPVPDPTAPAAAPSEVRSAPLADTPSAPSVAVPVRPARDAPPPIPPAPTRVEIPALGIDVRVRAVGVDEQGRMGLPESADVAGWYRYGAAPADATGATVVAAHVDDADSVGPFARLATAEPGDTVRVRTADGTAFTYTVESTEATAKAALSADRLFDRSGRPRLVLVTCGGAWDARARSYTDNVVVTAVRQR